MKGQYAKPHSLFRAQVSEGVTEIDGRVENLPDDYYDEFVFICRFWRAICSQRRRSTFRWCRRARRRHRWIEIPAAGSDYPELRRLELSFCQSRDTVSRLSIRSSDATSFIWRRLSSVLPASLHC